MRCTQCKGTGVKTDDNGIQYDDPCEVCDGSGKEQVGVAVQCTVCHRTKKPRGRSAPLGLNMCEGDCHGYYLDPKPGELWPGETREEFGY